MPLKYPKIGKVNSEYPDQTANLLADSTQSQKMPFIIMWPILIIRGLVKKEYLDNSGIIFIISR